MELIEEGMGGDMNETWVRCMMGNGQVTVESVYSQLSTKQIERKFSDWKILDIWRRIGINPKSPRRFPWE